MEDRRFDPAAVGSFRVASRAFDPDTRTATLEYAYESGPTFTETLVFETPAAPAFDATDPRLAPALLHLQIAAGTSYYKAAAPERVVVAGGLTPAELAVHRHLYDDGLREFAFANGLPVPRPVELVPEGPPSPAPAGRPARTRREVVVPVGGGKDSLVAVEALRDLAPRLLAVNPHPLVEELARRSGLELLVVRRTLSPELDRLNRCGARNGHVPITAIVSLIAVLGAVVWDYDIVAMAVERSASEETVLVDGTPVNHQYSKSLEAEVLLRDLVRGSIDPAITYGSALRPYAELAIARAFARLRRYHSVFCSCNAAFRRRADERQTWCGRCPKCRFVTLMLAPFLSRSDVEAIVGADLLGDRAEVPGFAALMSATDKPFECVGERRESAAAIRLLAEQPEWRDAPVVAALADRARSSVSDADVAGLLRPERDLAFPDPAVAGAVDRFFEQQG
jgi:hypothetical protein